MKDETKEERRERQNKAYRKMIKELQVDATQALARNAQRGAYYIHYKNIVEHCI